jgi:hypothetical protein
VSTKIVICEARRWAVAHNINDFAVWGAWCYRFMDRHRLSTVFAQDVSRVWSESIGISEICDRC